LTLIELLIVIVILTTLVGGVIPILSPNNDVRKIRTAARGLQGYINSAQAEAARTGRPQGITFRESAAETGVALEVLGLEVPPPFAGFSTASAVRIEQQENTTTLRVQFILADTLDPTVNPPMEYAADALPPKFIRYRDRIVINGIEYRFIETGYDPDTFFYDNPPANILVEQVNPSEQTLAFVTGYAGSFGSGQTFLTAPTRYQIFRAPTNSAAEPFQLPAGIVIDMQASVVEGAATDGWPTASSLYTDRKTVPPPLPTPIDSVGILFSPTGAVDRLLFNGVEYPSAAKIAIMLGRIENGGIEPNATKFPWVIDDPNNKEEVQDAREAVNWLNLDSRLLSIAARSGRVVVSETAFVDPNINETDPLDTAAEQIEAAHEFAHDMSTVGGE